MKSINRFYSKNDRDLILSGLLLKYIGRVKQYKYELIFSFSDIGNSEDCFILSRDIVKEFSEQTNKFPKKIINELIDVVMHDSEVISKKSHKNSVLTILSGRASAEPPLAKIIETRF